MYQPTVLPLFPFKNYCMSGRNVVYLHIGIWSYSFLFTVKLHTFIDIRKVYTDSCDGYYQQFAKL